MNTQFNVWLARLEGQVIDLSDSISQGDVGMVAKEANTCKAFLNTMYTYADKHQVDLNQQICNRLDRIETRLRSIEQRIERKMNRTDDRTWSRWQRGLHIVLDVIDIVAKLLGYGHLAKPLIGSARRLLSGRKNQKLLN